MKIINHEKLIFTFGSNLAGRHGAGAAKTAVAQFSAIYGQGEGFQGRSYAIPTKDASLNPLPLKDLSKAVQRFLEYARIASQETFQVTKIGCGLAGNKEDDILMIFKELEIPSNVMLPSLWERELGGLLHPRVIVAGGRDFNNYSLLVSKLDRIFSNLKDIEVISGGCRGVDLLGERYANSRGLSLTRFPAAWKRFGKSAGYLRNTAMAWYGTHLVVFWDGKSRGTKNMIDIAEKEGLNVRVVNY